MKSDRIRGRLSAGSFLRAALLSLAALLLLPGFASAQAALTDDADAKNGNTANLDLSAGSNVYLKFKLSSTLPADTPGAGVARATVKLYLGAVKAPGAVDVYQLGSNWNEQTVGSAPPALGAVLQTGVPVQAEQVGKFLVLDVTAAVRQWLGTDGAGAGGAPNYGVALVAGGGASVTFDSKENSQTSHEAQLNILLERGADGLSAIEHDASLKGEGMTAAPLGVAPAGISNSHLAADAVTGDKIADGAVTSSELADGSVTSAKITAPLSLSSADANFTLSVENTGAGAAVEAKGAIDTTAQYNIGGRRVLSNRGSNNLFAGVFAGGGNTTGGQNSFFGALAGASNTTGSSNSFFGVGAGFRNTAGSDNSFFGLRTGENNTEGDFNAFYANDAGASNTTGSGNSFFGVRAGFRNTTASFNAFFGTGAGQSNTAGSNNSFFGGDAGLSNTTGFQNSFFGREAGAKNTEGSFNSFFGRSTGLFNTTGSGNSFFGQDAGIQNTTGGNNTMIGAGANVGANNLNNATAVGAFALVTQSNSLVLGSGVSVGVGTTAPKAKLDVTGGNILVGSPGRGLILRSPDGATCRLLSIDNAGALTLAAVACP